MIRVPEVVMGTVVSFSIHAPGVDPGKMWTAVAEARAVLHDADAVFSTWKRDSPLNQLRRGEVRLEQCPRQVGEVLLLCAWARERSGGWFDPWALPGGVDPTGLVKGWAAARALDVLRRAGVSAALVSAGGDVATLGHPDADASRPWRVGITHPWQPAGLVGVVEVGGGRAVCTSGIYARGAHLIDPTTAATARRTVAATVTGPSLPLADALATAVAVGGDAALTAIERLDGYEGWLIRPDGSDAATAGWRFASARPAALYS
jgi:thiamine biosynthesis lipoprotein